MVNCKNCGAPLSLNEPVCPHCGTPNPEAQEHLKKLEKISKQYQKTEKEVVSQVKKNQRAYSVYTILVAILLANLILIPFHSASYEIADGIIARRLKEDNYKEKLDQYLANKEYDEFSVYFSRLNLNYNEAGNYNRYAFMIDEYCYVKRYVSDYLYATNTYSDPLVRACSNIIDFVSDYNRTLNYFDDKEALKIMAEINEEFELFIKTYLKLTDEDIEQIENLSNSELLVLVSGRLENNEE